MNAVTSGIKEIRQAVSDARKRKTIVFVDEIHRFNKIQQDALLPHIERGEIILIGASTENPFFALTPALASRTMLFKFNPLSRQDIVTLLTRALSSPSGFKDTLSAQTDALQYIADIAEGDARRALNILELIALSAQDGVIDRQTIKDAVQDKNLYYDENEHYDTVSAFIKSVRGSDPDASLYWLAKMLECGEDPLFIARRLIILASEDIGNADPLALLIAVNAFMAVERIGMPEGRLVLSQATIYLSTAPKSNTSLTALTSASDALKNEPAQAVPAHLKDNHYSGAQRLDIAGYKYPHDYARHFVQQDYMSVKRCFYEPSTEGYERKIKKYMNWRHKLDD
ncbi:recombination factor protein RarA [Candidatus Magnetoovum chiemensis]|nr:recombination factor protein RarA [Candidatus Magnetoovum chiemensis]